MENMATLIEEARRAGVWVLGGGLERRRCDGRTAQP
jgi:hypothetical protein